MWQLLQDKSELEEHRAGMSSCPIASQPLVLVGPLSYFELSPGPFLVLTGAAAEELGEQWCPSHQWESSGGYRREKEGGSVKERRAVKSHAGYLRCRTQSETKIWGLMSKN